MLFGRTLALFVTLLVISVFKLICPSERKAIVTSFIFLDGWKKTFRKTYSGSQAGMGKPYW